MAPKPILAVVPVVSAEPAVVHRLTARAFIAGAILAMILCAVNSYLTLSFGIMEEGPAIAALFFFAAFVWSRNKITVAEMVIVATMGSAGGSLGFIANFFAAKAMVGVPYTIFEMTLFGVVTSVIGLAAVILLRQILIVKDAELPEDQRLPWVGSKAVKGVIDALVVHGDPKQAWYLGIFITLAIGYVVSNTDGFGLVPDAIMFPVAGLAAYGLVVALSPFLIGGAYLMGFRSAVGFLAGAVVLLLMALHLETPAAPQKFVWPGIAFLVASGMTNLLLHWKVIAQAIMSLAHVSGGTDDTPIMSRWGVVLFTVVGVGFSSLALYFYFELTLLVLVGMIAVGGLVLNLIATRAAAQTAFNPARVMGILLQGVAAVLGGSSVSTNLAGAGMVAGSGAQAGNLTADMAYGFWYKVRASWQFWTQALTVVPCAFVAAWVFHLINTNMSLKLEGGDLAAPVAKIWATMGLLFDPESNKQLPPFALESMYVAGAAGILWALGESRPKIRRLLPCSIGLGLGLILPVAYDVGFFVGGVLM